MLSWKAWPKGASIGPEGDECGAEDAKLPEEVVPDRPALILLTEWREGREGHGRRD